MRARRLGGVRSNPLDFRLITATNRDLKRLVEQGHFRSDLFFRLNAIVIYIPPLRERKEDIDPLLERFLPAYRHKHSKSVSSISAEARKLLLAQAWPGNVRQLLYVLEYTIAFAEDDQLTLQTEDFSQFLDTSPRRESAADLTGSSVAAGSELLSLQQLHNLTLQAIDQWVIRERLKRFEGNISQAAKSLGISRASLHQRLKKHRENPGE
jgi:transcriptional regulator with PAS, ATPase and Fis domain